VGPVRFEFSPQTVSIFTAIPCTVHCAKWCQPCKRQERDNDDGDDRISFVYTEDPQPVEYDQFGRVVDTLPCTTFTDSTGKLRTIRGYHTTDEIWSIIQRNNPPGVQQSYAASGFGGAIHGRSQIQQVLTSWRERIGTSPVEFAWRRTGGQTFPLIHQQPKQWSCQNILGSLGEFSIEAPGSKLPVQPISIGYRRSVSGLELTGKVTVAESLLGFPGDSGSASQSSMADPSQIGPMTILTIVQVVQGVISILNPHVDLTLGGTVSATCQLAADRDELTINFRDMPGVKIVAWFTFNLSVKSLVITPENVHLEFSGSRWVKSRDLRVEQ
jgi:hypothetical protein